MNPMPGTNLTRAEAQERARLLKVDGYDVTLDLTSAVDPHSPTYRSTTILRFRCQQPGASTFVDLIAPKGHQVSLNGVELDPERDHDGARISLDGLAAEDQLRVVANAAYKRHGAGVHHPF